MKTVKYVIVAAALLSCAVSLDAEAAMNMKWCTTWRTHYVDAGLGEDTFAQNTLTNRPAQYAWGQLINLATGQTLWTGYFDGSGCTPYLPVAGYTQYELRQGTKLQRENRTFVVVHSGAAAGDWSTWYYYLQRFTTAAVPADSNSTTNLVLSSYNAHTNVLPILGRIIHLYSTMEYPSGTSTAVRTDNTECAIGSYLGNGRVCVDADYYGEDESTWKFITAHEVGHRQADATGGPLAASYGQVVDEELCKCDHVGGDSSMKLHCLQSREYIRAAQTEGWAQFYATRLFNDQTEGNGVFVYYKPFKTVLWGQMVVLQPPMAFDASYNARWMENNCQPRTAAWSSIGLTSSGMCIPRRAEPPTDSASMS